MRETESITESIKKIDFNSFEYRDEVARKEFLNVFLLSALEIFTNHKRDLIE